MNHKRWRRRLRVSCLSLLFLFVMAYQLGSSLTTVYVARHPDYGFIPFLVEPFSNRMYRVADRWFSDDSATQSELSVYGKQCRLLAVNHRPFRGLSVYLTQLWNHRDFSILVRLGSAPPVEALYGFGHCTCPVSPVWTLVQFFAIPPLVCVLLAFFVLWRRPGSALVWALAALLLSLTQIDLFPGGLGFQSLANPMAWPHPFRIPATAYRAFVQSIWPAALLVFAAHLLSRKTKVHRLSLWIAAPFLGFAVTRAVLAVAWSENYLPFVPLHQWLEGHSTELLGLGFGFTAWLGFLLRRSTGVLVGCLTLAALAILYGPVSPITKGAEVRIDGAPARLEPISPGVYYRPAVFHPAIPDPAVSPTLVVVVFAMTSFLVVLWGERRRANLVWLVSFVLLSAPLIFVLGLLGKYWTIWQQLWVINALNLCAGLGLLGVCRYCDTSANLQNRGLE